MMFNNVHPGEIYTIVLDGNPTTGYEWISEVLGDTRVIDVKSSYTSPNEQIPGRGGKYTFLITILKVGTCTLLLSYTRPWEKQTSVTSKRYNIHSTY